MTQFVETLRYKPEGREFDSLGFFVDLNPFRRTITLGSTQPLTEIGTRGISWGVKMASTLG